MDDIIEICGDLKGIESSLLEIFSVPLTEESCDVLMNCFLDELILNSDKTLDVSCAVNELRIFLERKAAPCMMKERQDTSNQTVLGAGMTRFDESNCPF